ncbi:acetyl coenzyme A:deacetylcephalosporin C o-acetyltransferase [Xylariomycetidae sp. FL2044]|nr:acetyl coenzyme A:deacetylcephalosporin C o-acetyltransferase [Xylariomycetidae sp. FL2044]
MSDYDTSHHSQPGSLPRQLYVTFDTFTLDSGSTIYDAVVAFTFQGLLNKRRDNAILVCHSFSDSAAMEHWLPSMLDRSHPALDSSKYCIICCNSLGSPYGSASPLTYRPRPGSVPEPYGANFPKTTVGDDLRIHKRILDILGVRSIHCVIGGGMGALLALEYALLGPKYVRTVVLMGTVSVEEENGKCGTSNEECDRRSYRPTALMTPLFMSGHIRSVREEQLASPPLEVSSCRTTDSTAGSFHDPSENQTYIRSFTLEGEYRPDLNKNCLRHLLDKAASHEISRSRHAGRRGALEEFLGQTQQPTLVIGRPPPCMRASMKQMEVYEHIPHVTFATIDSKMHDGFPTNFDQVDKLLHPFFDTDPLEIYGFSAHDIRINIHTTSLPVNLKRNEGLEVTAEEIYLGSPRDSIAF